MKNIKLCHPVHERAEINRPWQTVTVSGRSQTKSLTSPPKSARNTWRERVWDVVKVQWRISRKDSSAEERALDWGKYGVHSRTSYSLISCMSGVTLAAS